jgi:hypothetical protein
LHTHARTPASNFLFLSCPFSTCGALRCWSARPSPPPPQPMAMWFVSPGAVSCGAAPRCHPAPHLPGVLRGRPAHGRGGRRAGPCHVACRRRRRAGGGGRRVPPARPRAQHLRTRARRTAGRGWGCLWGARVAPWQGGHPCRRAPRPQSPAECGLLPGARHPYPTLAWPRGWRRWQQQCWRVERGVSRRPAQ